MLVRSRDKRLYRLVPMQTRSMCFFSQGFRASTLLLGTRARLATYVAPWNVVTAGVPGAACTVGAQPPASDGRFVARAAFSNLA